MDLTPIQTDIIEHELKEHLTDIVKTAFSIIGGDKTAVLEFFASLSKTPFFVSNMLSMIKYEKLINGLSHMDSMDRIRLLDKLLGDDAREREENAYRTLMIIEKADTLPKIDFILNAIHSFFIGMINREEFFRIATAVAGTLNEDLEYLKEHAIEETLSGNIHIHALLNHGIVISAGIDGNKSVEEQLYAISTFGKKMDRYCLSLYDDERQKAYKKMCNEANEQTDEADSNADIKQTRRFEAKIDAVFG